jgi:hypothetical protein
MQADGGLGDIVVPGPKFIEPPAMLPDFPSPRLRSYTRESVVAEGFEAMVSLGAINTRYKDFYDISPEHQVRRRMKARLERPEQPHHRTR